MFTNVGGKIKSLAKFMCYLGIALSVGVGGWLLYCIPRGYGSEQQMLLVGGIATIVVGSLLSWLGSLGLYGFGQLVESTERIEARVQRIEKRLNE